MPSYCETTLDVAYGTLERQRVTYRYLGTDRLSCDGFRTKQKVPNIKDITQSSPYWAPTRRPTNPCRPLIPKPPPSKD